MHEIGISMRMKQTNKQIELVDIRLESFRVEFNSAQITHQHQIKSKSSCVLGATQCLKHVQIDIEILYLQSY